MQQMVVAIPEYTSETVWLVKPRHEAIDEDSDNNIVRRGDIVRLEHLGTRMNLHSHSAPSPVLGDQQEITAFGSLGRGDENDNWEVEPLVGDIWRCDQAIRLVHVSTRRNLHSHKGSDPIRTAGFQEVTCFAGRDENDFWTAITVDQIQAGDEGGAAAFVARRTDLERLKKLLLGPHSGSGAKKVYISGLGGVGKSTLALTAAQDPQVKNHFPDGILRFQHGQSPEEILAVFSAAVGLSSIESVSDALAKRLRNALATRRMLVIYEGALDQQELAPLDILGRECVLLITTRSAQIDLPSDSFIIQLDEWTQEEALTALAKWVGAASVETLPEAARRTVQAIGTDPLVLRLVAANIRRPDSEKSWLDLLQQLRAVAASDEAEKAGGPRLNLHAALEVALANLTKDERDRFLALARFGEYSIPIAAVSALWKVGEGNMRATLSRLTAMSLVWVNDDTRTLEVHSFVRSFLAQKNPGVNRVDPAEVLRKRQLRVALKSESEDGDDCLDIMPEVEDFASVLALQDLQPPLCVGIFGNWGTGKSFFMRKLNARIGWLCTKSQEAEANNEPTVFCGRVAQVTFNAWHYVDTNLWASIGCQIFEGLDEYLANTSKSPEKEKAALFRRLETARAKVLQAESNSASANAEITEGEKKLAEMEKQRREKALKLQDVQAAVVTKLFNENPKVQTALATAAEQVGFRNASENVEELKTALAEARTLNGRFKAALLALLYGKDRFWRIAILILIILLIPVVGIGFQKALEYLNTTGVIARVSALFAQLGLVALALAKWTKNVLIWANGVVTKIDDARLEAENIVKSARAQPTEEEEKLRSELVALKQKQEQELKVLAAARERMQEAEAEKRSLEEGANGKILADFVRERIGSKSYHGQLGIISSIRRDLQTLSDQLATGQRAKPDSDMPRIDRIVLYIDDLDRCPERTVVDVLQAIHLLLAFPLFIVVIGVDSRWLLRSLRQQHAPLRGEGKEPMTESPQVIEHLSSTPQNYLDKIIQVPFNLRRMDEAGFLRLMESVVPFHRQANTSSIEAAGDQTPKGEEAVTTPSAGGTVTLSPDGVPEAPQPRPSTMVIKAPPPVEFVELTPEALLVTKQEVEFLSELVPLIYTPRAATRLGNIYRLVRAGIPETDLPAFLGETGSEPQFRAVIALLSIQVGYPALANVLFRQIVSKPDLSWEQLRKTFVGGEVPVSEDEHFRDRQHLATLIGELVQRKVISDHLGTYLGWIRRVNRYSFRSMDDN